MTPMTSPNPATAEAVLYARYEPEWGRMMLCNRDQFGAVEYRLAAAPAPASGVDAVVEAMENDPFWQDAPLAGTTQQDQRIRHYAEVALASLSPAATSGIAMPSREWMREKIVSDPDVEDCGAVPTSGSEAGGEPDMRRVCEALGFDPTNHHNAAKCPYCTPTLAKPASSPAGGDVREALLLVRPVITGLIDAEYNVETWGLKGRLAKIDAALDGARVCEVCGGDCSAANPPPSYCPERDATSAAEPVACGPFGHHPDPSTDFCVEVETLEGWAEDVKAGTRSQWPFWGRLSALLRFVRSDEFADLDEIAQRAKATVFELEGRVTGAPPAPAAVDGQRVKDEADLFARSLAWLADEPVGPAEGLVSEPEEWEEHRDWEVKMPSDFADAVAKARIRACLATDKERA